MKNNNRNCPPRAVSEYDPSAALLDWMIDQIGRVGDFYRANLYGSDVYFLNDVRHIKSILRDKWRIYSKNTLDSKRIRTLTGNGLITSDGGLWKKHRRLMHPMFHKDVICSLARVIVDTNLLLLDKWQLAARRRHNVNVTSDLNAMVLEIVLITIFGEDYSEVAPDFQFIAEESARNLEFAESFRPLREVVSRVALKRRTESGASTDILGLLMRARDRDSGETMALDELVTEIMTLIVAGFETTSLTLAWTWYLLSLNPDVDAKLGDSLKYSQVDELCQQRGPPSYAYTRQVLDEALRLYPPIWAMARKASIDDYLGDYFVPAGTEIYFSPYIIQRSPALWEAPDRFDPCRFNPDRSKGRHPFAMLPFGAGPRNCIGEGLALFEMQIHLNIVAQKLRLRYDEPIPAEFEIGINLRPKRDFFMFPECRTTPNGHWQVSPSEAAGKPRAI